MKGWETKKLGDVCQIIGGGTPSKDNRAFYNGDIPWATVRDMKAPLLTQTEHQITNEAVKNSATNIIPAGNVVIATRVGLGKVSIVSQDTAINQDLRGIIPVGNQILPRYLFWWFTSIAQVIVEQGTGATVQGVKRSFIENLPFRVPPLMDQQRIVAIMDEAFAGLETMRAQAAKNIQNAREVYESHIEAVFSAGSDRWVRTTIGNEADLVVGFAFRSDGYVADGCRLLRGDNIIQGKLRWDDGKYWAISDVATYEAFLLNEGDIVLAMDRTWVKAGLKFAQISKSDLPALLVQRVARLRVDDPISRRFIYHTIGSRRFTDYVLAIQTGLGVPHISGNQIASFEYLKPPITEQEQLCARIDDLAFHIDRLEAIYRRKLAAIDELKKSILQRAFSGELTAPIEIAA